MLDLLFPPVCFGCRRLLRPPDLDLCPACAVELLPCSHPIAPFLYEGPPRRALHALKYGGDLGLAGPLARLLLQAPALRDPGLDRIVPVPLHAARQRQRGFNQTWVLLRRAARVAPSGAGLARLGPDVLRRTRATRPQVDLRASQRRANVEGAFAVSRSAAAGVRGRRVLIVDDVTTTGATLEACADALRTAGAQPSTLALMRAVA